MVHKPGSSGSQAEPIQVSHPFRVLVVDPADDSSRVLERCADEAPGFSVSRARTLAEAEAALGRAHVDLAVIEADLPDGSGLALADRLNRGRRTGTLVVSDRPDLDSVLHALRAGVSDFLIKPLDLEQVSQRVQEFVRRRQRNHAQAQRVKRLRAACRKLSEARVDVSRQVDILCNDLVTAYQELAEQVHQITAATEYQARIGKELDLEHLVRKTLEFLIDKAGPTNAAVFLPCTADEYSLGGYVNYSFAHDDAELLLEQFADALAPRVAEHGEPIHLTTHVERDEWVGPDAVGLEETELLSFSAVDGREPLAVLVLFRNTDEPYDPRMLEVCYEIAPLLGRHLARIIRMHHRHLA